MVQQNTIDPRGSPAGWGATPADRAVPAIRRIELGDLQAALRQGLRDFGANRTDILFLCLLYPIIGLLMAYYAIGIGILPVLFPLAMGFVLVGPVAAVGLNEMSRRRELGEEPSWRGAFGVLHSPSLRGILAFAAILVLIFAAWMVTAQEIYDATLGTAAAASVSATEFAHTMFATTAGQMHDIAAGASRGGSLADFMHDVFNTAAGWKLIVFGVGTGFLFALFVLSISVVTFPMLLDRPVSVATAIGTSLHAMRTNPGPMLAWGLIVAVLLVIGLIPALLGLAFVLPVLGHATWHLYRRMVV